MLVCRFKRILACELVDLVWSGLVWSGLVWGKSWGQEFKAQRGIGVCIYLGGRNKRTQTPRTSSKFQILLPASAESEDHRTPRRSPPPTACRCDRLVAIRGREGKRDDNLTGAEGAVLKRAVAAAAAACLGMPGTAAARDANPPAAAPPSRTRFGAIAIFFLSPRQIGN